MFANALARKTLAAILVFTVCTAAGAFSPVRAKDDVRCASANARSASAYSQYQSDRTAYDYCTRYGDTSGTGYGSKDCGGAYSSMNSSKSAYDSAVSEQWQYCY